MVILAKIEKVCACKFSSYFVCSLFKRLVRMTISVLGDQKKKGSNRWFASAVEALSPSYSILKTLIRM